MHFIGIDPGKNGGVAVIRADKSVVATIKMPENPLDLWVAIAALVKPGECFAALEGASSSPQMGVASAFTYGKGYGQLTMMVLMANIPHEIVYSRRWQNVLQCNSGGDKNITKARAVELFPGVKVTHANADALLIAEYGRRQRLGLIPGKR